MIENPNNSGISNPKQDAADHIHQAQAREQLENKIRIKKSEIVIKERRIHDIDRDLRSLLEELHRIAQEEKHLSDEVHKFGDSIKHDVGASKTIEMGLRDTTTNLHLKEDEIRKLEREIAQFKQQIIEKEHAITEIKGDTRDLARDKEEFRRSSELGHFSIKGEEEHLHERQVKLQLLSGEKLRKENEHKHKEDEQRALHREISSREQEVMQMETNLSQIKHS